MNLMAIKSFLGTVTGKVIAVASLGLLGVVGGLFVNKMIYSDKMVFNFSTLDPEKPEQQKDLMNKPLSEHLKVGDFLPQGLKSLGGNKDLIIKQPVVDTLEHLISKMHEVYPDAPLKFDNGYLASGYRFAAYDREVGGSGSGPHTRGNAVDVEFNVPNVDSFEVAQRTAWEGYKLGVKGIEIDYDAENSTYSVHIDPITARQENWYAEECAAKDETGRARYVKVDPVEMWGPDNKNIAGTWLLEWSMNFVGQGWEQGTPMEVSFVRIDDGGNYRAYMGGADSGVIISKIGPGQYNINGNNEDGSSRGRIEVRGSELKLDQRQVLARGGASGGEVGFVGTGHRIHSATDQHSRSPITKETDR
jgi:hypothetical protein